MSEKISMCIACGGSFRKSETVLLGGNEFCPSCADVITSTRVEDEFPDCWYCGEDGHLPHECPAAAKELAASDPAPTAENGRQA
jgi:hypothetical protein